MDWAIAGFVGLVVGCILSAALLAFLNKGEKTGSFKKHMDVYNKSSKHYRDGDNT